MSVPFVTNANNVYYPLSGQKRSCPSVSITSPKNESLNTAGRADRKIILNTLQMTICNNIIMKIQDINSKMDILKEEIQNHITRFKLVNDLEVDKQTCQDLLKMGNLEEVTPELCETAVLFGEELIQFAQTFKKSIIKISQLTNELKNANDELKEANHSFEKHKNDNDRESAFNPTLQQISSNSNKRQKENSDAIHHSLPHSVPAIFTSNFSPNFIYSFLQVPIIPVRYDYPVSSGPYQHLNSDSVEAPVVERS